MKKTLIAVLAALSFVPLSVSAGVPVRPSITVTADRIAISGMTPGSSGIMFSVGDERHGDVGGRYRSYYVLPHADDKGNVQVKPGAVPRVSIWCVVDIATGEYALATPAGYELRRVPFPGNALRAVNDHLLNRLSARHEFLDVLWVRAGLGAWHAFVADGGSEDADGTQDGHASVAPEKMRAVGTFGPPPAHFLPVDTFVLVDPDTMEVFASEVVK